jgi:hypothetical protein
MEDVRTAALVQAVTMMEAEALTERSYRLLRRLVCWRRIRRMVDERSREVVDGI